MIDDAVVGDAEPSGDGAAVAFDGVVFSYGKKRGAERARALDGVGFEVARGAMVGLIGPNGSGKSTCLRLMTGRLKAEAGRVAVLGVDPGGLKVGAGAAWRSRVGVVFQSPAVDGEMTVVENLRVHAGLLGLGWGAVRGRAVAGLEAMGLAERRRERVERLSGGQRRRVELIKATLGGPELLVLDEPTAGLDPEATAGLWDALDAMRAAEGLTVVVSTHLGDDVARCDRLVLLDGGKVLTEGRPSELIDRAGGDVVTLTCAAGAFADEAELSAALGEAGAGLAWVRGGDEGGAVWRARVVDGAGRVPGIAGALGERLVRVSVGPPGLADVFGALREAKGE